MVGPIAVGRLGGWRRVWLRSRPGSTRTRVDLDDLLGVGVQFAGQAEQVGHAVDAAVGDAAGVAPDDTVGQCGADAGEAAPRVAPQHHVPRQPEGAP